MVCLRPKSFQEMPKEENTIDRALWYDERDAREAEDTIPGICLEEERCMRKE